MYRAIWAATLVSNLGVWMQSVGAAWLMTTIAPSADMVALVQSATALPVLLFSLVGGILADLWDRRLVFLTGQSIVLTGAAVLATLGVAPLLRLPRDLNQDLSPLPDISAPPLAPGVQPGGGLVAVTVEYRIEPEKAPGFVRAMRPLRRLRLHDGALRWTLYQDSGASDRWVEAFILPSWFDGLRHQRRLTVADRAVIDRANAFHIGGLPLRVSHLIARGGRRLHWPP